MSAGSLRDLVFASQGPSGVFSGARGLIGDVFYGGHVCDSRDRRLLDCFLQKVRVFAMLPV